ncbi:unnamed protein product (macronuclear) [Paramecium tetraurelia]|uniref:Chromosome undetermined scaffold_1, whole genome shotgun sequence n=1 Tax=Paramecium tetraurelia TaxID=5888 RepID=Q6BGC6_PARTE|nr:hypothetical protein [Paramecium tetraurelia strain d4-2]XP_001423408.1 uncharacterized protein GSPATT00000445001 [Paramecium tetraurelia]CAH03294.1 hypothetical protein PTMB.97c [Paramecium tetraurelia]CAK56010.1 unnamed protein product [Paramecium tetraurelia]|eukprot:XP_001423408.1 hypothetical protein (macronuclear) [Paramecium tetraurelia strain d4-2]
MNSREEDHLNQVDLDQAYDIPNQQGSLTQKINEIQDMAAEKYDDINQIVNYEMRVMQEKLGFRGERPQIYQQTALFVAVIQLIIATFLSMLISQTTFLGQAWTFIPWIQYLFILTYLFTILAIQCFSDKIQETRYNFGICCVHAVSKIILIVFISIWFFDIRVEIFLVALIAIQGYVTLKIYVPTQKHEEFDLKVKDLWKKMTIFQLCVSVFLMYFTRSTYMVGLLVYVSTLLIGIYTILCLQRFKEYSYFSFNSNDLYLGALQLEADMFLPCSLIAFQDRNKTQSPSRRSSDQSDKEKDYKKQDSEQRMAVQSIKSIAD